MYDNENYATTAAGQLVNMERKLNITIRQNIDQQIERAEKNLE